VKKKCELKIYSVMEACESPETCQAVVASERYEERVAEK
jgi:hypothetical protein